MNVLPSRKSYRTLEEMMEKADERDIILSKRTFELDIQAMQHYERPTVSDNPFAI